MITVSIEGALDIGRRLGVDLRPSLQGMCMAIGELVRAELSPYPRPPSHPIRWQSEKQRRFYFAMRREKGLPIGYTRQFDAMSQRLGPSWTVAKYGTIGAKVGTRVTYAPWVQDAKRQQLMHQETGWTTDEAAIDRVIRSGAVHKVAVAAVRKGLGL